MSASGRRAGSIRLEPWLVVTLLLVSLAALEGVWLVGRVRGLGDFGWDEAAHALWGLRIYRDVGDGNWLSLAFDSYRQVYWPFLHSWAIGAAMLALGPNPTAARVVSVLSFLVTAGVLAILGRRMSSGSDWVTPLVATGLWLTAAPMIDAIGVRALTDGPAIALTGLTFWALARAIDRPSRSRFALVGLLSMATYLTKTGFGVVLIASMLLTLLVWARRSGGPRVGRGDAVAYLAPVVIIAIVWFAYPPKVGATISALTNRAQGPSPLSWAGLTYHPRQLATFVGGWWMLALLGTAIGVAISRRVPPLVVALLLYIAVAVGLHTLSHTKDPKHIAKVVPWLFLLGGWAASGALDALHRRGRTPATMMTTALLALLVFRGYELIAVRPSRPDTFPGLRRTLVRRILPDRHNLVLGAFGGLGGPLIQFYLLAESRATLLYPDDHVQRFQALLSRWRTRHALVRALEHTPARRAVWVHVAPTRDQTDLRSPERLLSTLLASDAPNRILVIEVSRSSPWYDDRAFVFGGETFLPALRRRACYRLSERAGPERDVRLSVWDAVPGCEPGAKSGAATEPH